MKLRAASEGRMRDEKLEDEEGRLAALRRYQILDTAPEAPFDNITGLVRDVLEVPISAVTLVAAERQWFKSIVGLSICETSREVSFCSRTIGRSRPMIVPDARRDPRFADNPYVTGEPYIRSYLGVPLETPDGYNIGALCAIDRKPRAFTDEQARILGCFGQLVIKELELRQIATSDHLTGAMSRRSWIEAAERELMRCRRHGRRAAILLLDLDHFKLINDRHGHSAGDEVLRAVSQRCIGALRRNDLFGRLGGEEFAILLPETDSRHALVAAERIRAIVAETPVDVEAGKLDVTLSIGVCSLTTDMINAAAWLATADAGLYSAKAGGRDRCFMV